MSPHEDHDAKLHHKPSSARVHAEHDPDAIEAVDEPWYPNVVRRWLRTVQTPADVGLAALISPDVPGFQGLLKARCSDFIVHELEPGGGFVGVDGADNVAAHAPLTDLLGQQDMNEGRRLLAMQLSPEDVDPFVLFLLSDEQDEFIVRNAQHVVSDSALRNAALQHYHVRLMLRRNSPDGTLIVSKDGILTEESAAMQLPRDAIDWNALGGNFCQFTVAKRDMDTMAACSLFTTRLKTSVTYRGTKDRRAVTFQKMCAREVTLQQVVEACETLPNVRAFDFHFVKEPLRLAHSLGNMFVITIRDVKGSDSDINTTLEALKLNGFINYFGVQRFGTTLLPTFSVGVEWLNGNFKNAVDLIIAGSTGQRYMEARKSWFTERDPRKALQLFQGRCNIERTVLDYFRKKRNTADCYSALEALPALTQSMYLHSFQSYVWNMMVTERIRLFGRIPRVGDIVESQNPDDSITHCYITEENIKNYTMKDVVLPMPGFDVMYPKNEIGAKYVEFMAKFNVDPHKMKRKQKRASLPGAYRKLLGTVSDLSWEIKNYDDENSILTADGIFDKTTNYTCSGSKAHKAVTIRMTLDSSVYATTALREVLRD